MAKKDGSEFKLYYSTTALAANTDAAVKALSWTEVVDVATVERKNERSSNDFTARSGIIVTSGPQKVGLSATVAYDTTDAFYLACADAIKNNTEIAMADCDGDVTVAGTRGIAGNFKVTSFPLSEPDSGPATITIELEPSSFINSDYVAPV